MSWVILVWVLTFCFWVTKISQHYSNLKSPLNGYFNIVYSQRFISLLADIAVHLCKIKRRSAGNFFLKRANDWLYGNQNVTKNSPLVHVTMYVETMWSMRKQKLVDQLSCKISEIMRKTNLKLDDWRPFGFHLCEICHGLSLCETLTFFLYSWSSYFAFYVNISYSNSK